MEKDYSTDARKKKAKPPPPRPPPPYAPREKTIVPAQLRQRPVTSSNSLPGIKPRIPRRPPSLDDNIRRDRINSTQEEERTLTSNSLSDSTRQRSKSSTSLVFKEDLEKRLLSSVHLPQVHKTKPPSRTPGKLFPRYVSTPIPAGPNTSQSPSPSPTPLLTTPRKILSNSAPSTPPLSTYRSKRHTDKQLTESSRQYPVTSVIHPEGTTSHIEALQKASSKSGHILHAPVVKVNLTFKGKYTPRPAAPRRPAPPRLVLQQSNSTVKNKIIVSEENNVYAVPNHSHVTNQIDEFVIEPYATCQGVNDIKDSNTSQSQLETDFYIEMSSKSNIKINNDEDDQYVNSDLENSYMSLDSSRPPINNDSLYTDVRHVNHNNVYSIPTSISGNLSPTSDGYLSLSIDREQG